MIYSVSLGLLLAIQLATAADPNPILVEKWKQMFKYYDANGDGVVTKDDINTVDSYIAARDALTEQQKDKLKTLAAFLWSDQFFGSETSMTEDQAVAALENLWEKNRLGLMGREYTKRMFEALDHDGDKKISKSAFIGLAESLGRTTDADQEKAFDTIDTDGDGFISEHEFQDAFEDYAVSPDVTLAQLPLYGSS